MKIEQIELRAIEKSTSYLLINSSKENGHAAFKKSVCKKFERSDFSSYGEISYLNDDKNLFHHPTLTQEFEW